MRNGENKKAAEAETKVENFEFEPIKGYPMLNWKGKRPFTSTQFFPAQLKESYGKPDADGWMDRIYWGDNLQVMSHLLKEFRGKIDLIYIDPPFDSNADYKKKIKLKGKEALNDHSAFEEKQYADIWSNDGYLQFMYDRIILMRELLSDHGSLYIHCDQRVSSYLKIICEELFGKENFRSWICWKSSPGHSDHSFYGNMQNHILFFSKGASPKWNEQFVPYDDEYLDEHYQKKDPDGRRFEDDNLTAYGLSGGGYEYEWKGVTKLWRCPIETMRKLDKDGSIYYTKNGVARFKRYLDKMPGAPLSDLWLDIPRLNSRANEKLNYPTQKPETLVERIVKASSNEGDLIFDCFMGSGTTQAVAQKLGRRFIGADINLGAIQISAKRLIPKTGMKVRGIQVYNVNNYDIFRNPVEAKELVLQALEISKLSGSIYDGEKDGRMVKIMPVNRIATRSDLTDLISGFDYKTFEKRQKESPNKVVEKILLVCMGHEPDLAAFLEKEVPYNIDVEIVDILRDKSELQFKREAEAKISAKKGILVVEKFFPMNLLQKLSLQKEKVGDWKELVESILIDWNYDGAVLEPSTIDIPEKEELVKGAYEIPNDAGTIRVKITDLLSESLELEVPRG